MRGWKGLEAMVTEYAVSDLGDGTVNHKIQGEMEESRAGDGGCGGGGDVLHKRSEIHPG